ncbi:MAG: hypothetical protein HYX38_21000 [Rhodospirillales bacterium]|nr:hypothetical protein [Rhodospirillales bacterium]
MHMLLLAIVLVPGRCLLRRCSLDGSEQTDSRNGCGDAAAIESKVREIENLRSDQRLTFIRAVGDAGKLLTSDQQKMVHGLMPMPSNAPMSKPMK